MKTNEKNTCPVNSHTEWELLEEVIVGNPENAFVSFWDPVDKLVYSTAELAEIEQYLKRIGVRVKSIAQRINEGNPLAFVVDFKIKVLGYSIQSASVGCVTPH